ncbi:hypothetical protein KP509_10G078400 [Ceratopteris richardii]|uniref:Upstream activation factor subunit spp27 n=1 Tax=Ceratopteris richardii TaxID=49495 RepID=A0A8T2U2N7_CERRI|nr:hypothetical protein KP509_10G078400 [Ceratopteris richardii]KAH7428167.1 hypothetical protein KP509_10G078400 [Ceratopteris richardii]
MASDDQIVKRIGEILATADLTTTTTAAIRRQLEQEFDIDLSGRKAFVREQVDLYLETHPVGEQQEQEAEDEVPEMGEDAEAAQDDEEASEDREEDELEEEGEMEEKPEQDSKRLQAKIDRAKRESLKQDKRKRASGGGYTKLCKLSEELEAVMGEKEMARTQVVKSLWAYIREHNLQDPGDKRKILCDGRLEAVFGTKCIDMFKMNKALNKHIWPVDSIVGEGGLEAKKPKLDSDDEGQSKSRKTKSEKKEAPHKDTGRGRGGGFVAPLPISDSLRDFLGTDESELPRSEVVKRMWAYIKEKNLQNPSDKRQILCDDKLKKLLGCETFLGFGMTKHLASHFLKNESAN